MAELTPEGRKELLASAKRDMIWSRIDIWLRRQPVKESFIETFELVDKLCEALEIAESCEPDESRRQRSERLIERVREVTGA